MKNNIFSVIVRWQAH